MENDPDRLAYWLLKEINRAIREHGMIRDGERVAVAVSGGKDSLGLLRLLELRRRRVPERSQAWGASARRAGRDALRCGNPFVDPDVVVRAHAAAGVGYVRVVDSGVTFEVFVGGRRIARSRVDAGGVGEKAEVAG